MDLSCWKFVIHKPQHIIPDPTKKADMPQHFLGEFLSLTLLFHLFSRCKLYYEANLPIKIIFKRQEIITNKMGSDTIAVKTFEKIPGYTWANDARIFSCLWQGHKACTVVFLRAFVERCDTSLCVCVHMVQHLFLCAWESLKRSLCLDRYFSR